MPEGEHGGRGGWRFGVRERREHGLTPRTFRQMRVDA
jgi:hypothetical protein